MLRSPTTTWQTSPDRLGAEELLTLPSAVKAA
jgi:hypothetical protein